ncbi:hypothetical protein ABII15_38125 [Streptomyces sp. HUAS MG91]|uniref:Uncharacterized protein n=1 Tax=Streptomyces tabacisoli TaxID=3156398 RepID=A0AAU8J6A1_9ACTN
MVFVLGGLVFFAFGIAVAVFTIHALIYDRMPTRWAPKLVRAPRIWAIGVTCAACGGATDTPTIVVVGLGIMAIGHLTKPTG